MVFICKVCGYEYDESKESTRWGDLSQDWVCPVCGVGKDMFEARAEKTDAKKSDVATKTSSDILAETMANWGVKWVFGMVGHSNLGMADAIRKRVEAGDMKYIGIRHEGAAAFACSAYGKLTAKPAACLTIAGPGATNLTTGLLDARLDSSPVLALMGQIPSCELGKYAFQEVDLDSVFGAIAVSQQALQSTSHFGNLMSKALRDAIVNKGVSQIILPDDFQVLPAPSSMRAGSPDGFVCKAKISPASADLKEAAAMLSKYERPIIIVGEGCRRCMGQVLDFAKKHKIPMMTTYRAKGFLSDDNPLACGVVGRSGTAVSAKIMAECDVIIGLGTNFSKHSEIPKDKAVLQIDSNRAAFGRLRKVEFALLGDIAETLPLLSSSISPKREFIDRGEEIKSEWKLWREEKSRRAKNSAEGLIDPAAVAQALSKTIPEDAIVSVDVGNVAYSFGRYFEAKNQRMLLSFYLGSIGCGVPAAMGAWCATQEDGEYKNRQVIAVVGDGGLGQYLAEIATIAKSGMDIKIIVYNNSELAKISLEQRNARFNVWETKLINPDFCAMAKSCGMKAFRISSPDALEPQLHEAMSCKGAALVEIAVAP